MKTYSTKPGKEQSENIVCNFCGERNDIPVIKTDDYRFVKCSSCGLIYQNPQPKEDDLLRRYGDHYFNYELENAGNFFNLMLLGLEDISFFSYADRWCKEKKFLDIGCATGMLLQHMKKLNWKEKGVEVCEEAARYGIGKRGVDIVIGTLQAARFNNESFSAVHCSHLVEHLTDPRSFFAEVRRILKPSGLFIVATPNIDGFQAKLFKEKWRSAIADHMVLFSKKTLENYFSEYGFTVLKNKTWGGLAEGSAPRVLKRITDRTVKVLGWGDVMIYLVQKSSNR